MFDLGSAERNALDWCKALAIAAMQQSRRWAAGQTWWLGEVRGPCLLSRHAHRILIVTSAYHTRPALAIFRHRLPQYPVERGGSAQRVGLRRGVVAPPGLGEDVVGRDGEISVVGAGGPPALRAGRSMITFATIPHNRGVRYLNARSPGQMLSERPAGTWRMWRWLPGRWAARTLRLLENFLRPLSILEFNSDDAVAYAQVRAKLERAGTPIGPLDTLIAAQALARRLVLVSNNEREFGRVAGLNIQNWTKLI